MKKIKGLHALTGRSKRVYFEEELMDSDGKLSRTIKFYSRASEPAYFKVYQESLNILRRLSFISVGLLCDLVFLADYPQGQDAEQGGVIDLNPRVREDLLVRHNLSASRFQGILGQLVEAEFMVRVGRGSYQINPSICARGQWRDICSAGDMFQARYAHNSREAKP